MKSLRWGAVTGAIAIMASVVTTGCHPTFLVVPGAERDTVTDTIRVPDGRTRLSPIRPGPTRVDTVLRVDTVRVPVTRTVVRSDTVVRVDTVRVRDPGTNPRPRRPPGAGTPAEPVNRVDTVRVTTTDTIVRVDTVRVAGQRLLFLPPGHQPPEGQCRVWIHGLPPGQQAKAAACTALGTIPAGSFILFGGDAWDFDYDWLAEAASSPGSVPPEIIALQRRGRGR